MKKKSKPRRNWTKIVKELDDKLRAALESKSRLEVTVRELVFKRQQLDDAFDRINELREALKKKDEQENPEPTLFLAFDSTCKTVETSMPFIGAKKIKVDSQIFLEIQTYKSFALIGPFGRMDFRMTKEWPEKREQSKEEKEFYEQIRNAP